MKTYIQERYEQEMVIELAAKISSGEISASRMPRYRTFKAVADPETGHIQSISFRRLTPCYVHADIIIDMAVTFPAGDAHTEQRQLLSYRADFWIDLEDKIICDYGRFRCYTYEEPPDGRLLSEYLVPFLSHDDVEEEAESILFRYCPEALHDPKLLNPWNLTHSLGLHVSRLPLANQDRVESILFFCDGEVLTQENDHAQTRIVAVPADTIVLNQRYPKSNFEKNAIFHECFHYVEHEMFFRLQAMYSNDPCRIPQWKPKGDQQREDDPIGWLEWQARYGSLCLQMPRSMIRPRAKQALDQMRDECVHNGVKMQSIGRMLAREFCVPNYRARNRLIQVGYPAAKGALNYIGNGYIRPFAFAYGSCLGRQTFVIGLRDAIRESVRNPTFRELLDSGRYVYVDGHFCMDDPKYVRHDRSSLSMTLWANAHADQCCLRFVITYTQDRHSTYVFGRLNSDEEYNARSLTLSLKENSVPVMKRAKAISEILMNLPNSFQGTLKAHMIRCDVSIEKLAELAMLSDSTVKRLRQSERHSYDLDQVLAICLALHLPPDLSFDLIAKAGIRLRNTAEHLVYRTILRTMYMESLETIQATLKECGCQTLHLKDVG